MFSFYLKGGGYDIEGYIIGGIGAETSFLYKSTIEGERRAVGGRGLVLRDKILNSDTGKYIFSKEFGSFLGEL